jgi:hypothetical protein
MKSLVSMIVARIPRVSTLSFLVRLEPFVRLNDARIGDRVFRRPRSLKSIGHD